jgi:internalin A
MKEKTGEDIAVERIEAALAGKTWSTKLDLSKLRLSSLPEAIWKLGSLISLDLSDNRLVELPPEIEQFYGLSVLNLSNNRLSQLPAEIKKLRLTSLNLQNNGLLSLPSVIGQLRFLTSLDLANNDLTEFPLELSKLKLTSLNLHKTGLITLPAEISQFSALTSLDLSSNTLKALPSKIGRLALLSSLNLANNALRSLPPEIGKLSSLVSLNLSNNVLRSLPKEISQLSKLNSLDLSKNPLSTLPEEIQQLIGLTRLDLHDVSLGIPPEILGRIDEPQRIFEYYFGDHKKPLNEVKVILVGQGSVGKTSLVLCLRLGSFNPRQTKTEGISISHWQVADQSVSHQAVKPKNNEIHLNLWDFGGQEIMHATHQFFITKRSLYLLVLDSRLTQEENRVEYWLKIIQSFGGESPVLIVGNKIDQHPLDIDRTGLQKKYPNIVGILETSAAAPIGIEELKAAITEQVNKLPHVRDLLPDTWFAVKTKLEQMGKESNFISHDDYDKLCDKSNIHDEISQHTLIGFLHDLGVVLYFRDDPRLEALGILNPQWVTNGVYKILNSHALFRNKGVLAVSMLDEILNLPEYPRGKRLFIVDMMKKFELCYDIEPDKIFLVPDLLPKDEPIEMEFTGIPAFEYAYPVLPSSVITRFIVRMNLHIHDGCVWRTGVLLKIGGNKALVKADVEDRKITIAIDGLEHTRRDALSAIRYQLDEIHASIKGLEPQKRVPVPNAANAEPLKYEYLLKLERAGQEILLVENGNDLVTVNVRQMLSAIETEAQRKENGGTVTNIYIGGNVESSNIVSGNSNVVTQKIQDSFKKADAADIQAELKETLKQLADAVAVMAKSLPDEQAAEVSDDLSKLVDEATKPKPNKKWYSVSVDGLIQAAENVEKVGEPVIRLSQKVLSLLTGGVIK